MQQGLSHTDLTVQISYSIISKASTHKFQGYFNPMHHSSSLKSTEPEVDCQLTCCLLEHLTLPITLLFFKRSAVIPCPAKHLFLSTYGIFPNLEVGKDLQRASPTSIWLGCRLKGKTEKTT